MKHISSKFTRASIIFALIAVLIMTACSVQTPNIELPGERNELTPESYDEVYSLLKAARYRNGYYGGALFVEDSIAVNVKEETAGDLNVGAPTAFDASSSGDESYVVGTNVQVGGVDETDLIKTDGRYIFVSDGANVKILKADGADTKKLSDIEICKNTETKTDHYYGFGGEHITGLFTNGDTMAIIINKYGYMVLFDENGDKESKNEDGVEVRLYDISNPESPELTATLGTERVLQRRPND